MAQAVIFTIRTFSVLRVRYGDTKAHSSSATDQALRQLFESYGTVDTVNIITDRDTGRSKGFGFVEMPETQAAIAAIDGRALTVNEARPREPRRAPSRARW